MCVDLEILPSETNVAKNIGGNSEIMMRGRSQLHVYHACYFGHLVLSLCCIMPNHSGFHSSCIICPD